MHGGRSASATLASLAALALAALGSAAPAQAATDYRLTWLGTLGTDVVPQALNDAGTVVGQAVVSGQGGRAFVWDAAGGLRVLSSSPVVFEANDVNSAGVIAASGRVATSNVHAVVATPGSGGYTLADLGTLGGTESQAFGIDDDGTVVGLAQTSGNFPKPFIRRAGAGMTALPTSTGSPNFNDGRAWDVAGGQVVGLDAPQVLGNAGKQFGIRWNAAAGTIADDLAATQGRFGRHGVNGGGTVAGDTQTPAGYRAFIQFPSQVDETLLPSRRPDTPADAVNAINDQNWAVGISAGQAVLWRNGTLTELADVTDTGGESWTLDVAQDINEHGDIVGYGQRYDAAVGVWRAKQGFLLKRLDSPFDVTLKQGALVGDVFELGVRLTNKLPEPVSAIAPVVAPGLYVTTGAFPAEQRADVAVVLPPAPAFPTALAAGATSEHVGVLIARSRGYALGVSRFTATDPRGAPYEDTAIVQIEVSPRQPDDVDLLATFAGGFLAIVEDARARTTGASTRMTDAMLTSLNRWRPKFGKKQPTAFERALARMDGLDERTYVWLPDNPTEAWRLYSAHERGAQRATVDTLKRHAGSAYEFGLKTPFEFWTSFITTATPQQRTAVGLELVRATVEAKDTTAGYLGTAADYWTDPAKRAYALEEAPQIAAEAKAKAGEVTDRVVKAGTARMTQFGKTLRDDPERAAEQLGYAEQTVRAEIGIAVAENAIGAGITTNAKRFASAWKVGRTFGAADELADAASLERLAVSSTEAATSLDEAAALGGMTTKQVETVQGIIKRVEGRFVRWGLKLEVQFRPTNAWSAGVKGYGKVELIPVKALTPDDLLLGAHPSGLGKAGMYRPKRPPHFDGYDAATKQRLNARYDSKRKEYDAYTRGIGAPADVADMATMRKALKPNGNRYSLRGKRITMELDEVRAGDTILLQYRKLEINGRKLVKGPTWVKSDLDPHAAINIAGGANVPTRITGQMEVELLAELRKAASSDFPFGHHGWTLSSFDVHSDDFADVMKYALMYMDEASARRAVARWAPGKTLEEVLGSLGSGKFVVKITESTATLGPGAGP